MNLNLHHVGFVVKNIDKSEECMLLGEKTGDIVDPIQQARLTLYDNFSNSFIELIQPLNEKSFTWNALKKKGDHFNHLCYDVPDFSAMELVVKRHRLIEILKPVPAVLFQNKLVTFYYTRTHQIVEFLIKENES